jgi:hypothetical protein
MAATNSGTLGAGHRREQAGSAPHSSPASLPSRRSCACSGLRPAGKARNPAGSITPRQKRGAVANATSWPAPISARARGTMGWKCPNPGMQLSSTHTLVRLKPRSANTSPLGTG